MSLSKFFNAKPSNKLKVPQKDTRPKIYIGIPCHDSRVHSNYAMSIWDLVDCRKYNLTFTKTSSGGITKARNDLANRFLLGDWEYLLFTDTDVQFNHDHLDMMLARNVDIIGAMYPHKRNDLAWSAQHLPNVEPKDGLQEVAGLGFGFILIKRHVFTTMIDKMSEELRYKETWNSERGSWKYGFFQERIFTDTLASRTDPEWFTEDFYFTYNARKCGFKIYTDNRFHLKHDEGGQTFPKMDVMTVVDTLFDYKQGLADGGKKAGEVLHNVYPGWEVAMDNGNLTDKKPA